MWGHGDMALGQCPNCRHSVSSGQSYCPYCGKNLIIKDWKISRTIGSGAVLIVAFGFLSFLGWYAFGGGEDRKRGTEKDCEDQSFAFVYSKQVIKSDLTFPSSANFPQSPSSRDVSVSNIGGCTHQVVAWVDSNNPLGAKIRTYYTVIMQYRHPAKDWFHLTPYIAFDQSREALVKKANMLRLSYKKHPPAPPKTIFTDSDSRARSDSDAPVLNAQDSLKEIQRMLAVRGYDIGPIDGFYGPKTRKAISNFQSRERLNIDGYPSKELLKILNSLANKAANKAANKGYLGFAAKSDEGLSNGSTCRSYGGRPVADQLYGVVLHMGRRDALRSNIIYYGQYLYVTFRIETKNFWGSHNTVIALCHFAG